jgi:hypothetical protein
MLKGSARTVSTQPSAVANTMLVLVHVCVPLLHGIVFIIGLTHVAPSALVATHTADPSSACMMLVHGARSSARECEC